MVQIRHTTAEHTSGGRALHTHIHTHNILTAHRSSSRLCDCQVRCVVAKRDCGGRTIGCHGGNGSLLYSDSVVGLHHDTPIGLSCPRTAPYCPSSSMFGGTAAMDTVISIPEGSPVIPGAACRRTSTLVVRPANVPCDSKTMTAQ